MPGLFWKLFAAFWLTAVAILGVSIFASFQLANQHAGEWVDPREADAFVQEIAAEGGRDAVIAWLEDSGAFPPGHTVYLVDSAGVDIAGRALPDRVSNRALRQWSMLERGRPDRARARRPFRPVIHEIGASRYVAVPGPAAVPRFGVLSSTGLQWLILAIAAAISLVAFWWLSRSLVRPIEEISSAAHRLAGGEMSARTGSAATRRDELGQLSRQFDRMAAEIESQDSQRQRLFRNISHELRAPLARLQIAAEMLQRAPEETPVHRQRIVEEIEVLDRLTGQVLALARLAHSGGQLVKVDVAELLADVVERARYEAQPRAVTVRYDAPDAAVMVMADPAQLASAFENVIRNAILVAPPNTAVTVVCNNDDGQCIVTVRDHGPGVAEADLQRIFEPFFRTDQNRPGSGIGLAITARVIQDLGGSVVAQNCDDGGLLVTIDMGSSLHISHF